MNFNHLQIWCVLRISMLHKIRSGLSLKNNLILNPSPRNNPLLPWVLNALHNVDVIRSIYQFFWGIPSCKDNLHIPVVFYDFKSFIKRNKLFFQNAVYLVQNHNIITAAFDYVLCMLPALHCSVFFLYVRLKNKSSSFISELLKMLLPFLQCIHSKLLNLKT